MLIFKLGGLAVLARYGDVGHVGLGPSSMPVFLSSRHMDYVAHTDHSLFMLGGYNPNTRGYNKDLV